MKRGQYPLVIIASLLALKHMDNTVLGFVVFVAFYLVGLKVIGRGKARPVVSRQVTRCTGGPR